MALILCPECGCKISDKASSCPHCGFCAADEHGLVPISSLPPAPRAVAIEIPDAEIFDDGTNLVSRGMREKLAQFIENAEEMARQAPAIYNATQKIMAKRGTIWAADFSAAAEKLMESGELVLSVEKETGEFLPQLRSVKNGRIFEKARLHQEVLPNDVAESLATVRLQMSMAEMMGKIESVAADVEALRLETRGDRIAAARSVWLRLQSAAQIEDARMREMQILRIADAAIEQRSIMQENFRIERRLALSKKGKADERGRAAKDAITDLTVITLMAKCEYAAYSLLDEPVAAKASIRQFGEFIAANKLDNIDVLRELNSISNVKCEPTTKNFHSIAKNATHFVLTEGKTTSQVSLPPEVDEDEQE